MRRLTVSVVILILWGAVMSTHAQQNKSTNLPALFNDDGDDFIIIAHRGASAQYPENTMAAFRGAVQMQADMIELDVMLSKDGVPVVFHDATLDAHSDGTGPVANHTLEELKKLDAGSWSGSTFSGEQIPTLEEVLKFSSQKIALNIEIKTESVTDEVKGGVEQKSLDLVKKYGMEEHVIFSSFDYRAVAHLKELNPQVPVALLYNKRQSEGKLPSELVAAYKADAFNCSYRQLSKKRWKDLQSHRISTFIYTVDSPRRMKKLIKKGVSGIFTNKPDVLRGVVSNLNQDR
jgi:glycerophosphoryl diester phosphodiesterase